MNRSPKEALARDLQEGADEIGRSAGRAARRLSHDVADLAADAGHRSKDLVQDLSRAARARPRTVLAIGAAAGVLLAFLFRRRRR